MRGQSEWLCLLNIPARLRRRSGAASATASSHSNESPMTRILIVDEYAAATRLASRLADADIANDVALDGREGTARLLGGDYDLAIVELALAGPDGWTVLESARRAGCTTPVLFLSGRDDVDTCVQSLDLGADDYIVKPFDVDVLLARIRVILRRRSSRSLTRTPTALALRDLRLDLLQRRAWRGADRLELTPKEFALLSFLVQRAGQVQSYAVLAARLWQASREGDSNVVKVAIRRLRAKLDDPYAEKLLRTVRGVGYVIGLGEFLD